MVRFLTFYCMRSTDSYLVPCAQIWDPPNRHPPRAFRNALDFTAVPRESFFGLLRQFIDNPMEKEKFEEFCSPEAQVRLPANTPAGQRTDTHI